MEEYRANLISQKIDKILQRQKGKNNNKKNMNKSQENNSTYNIQNNMIDNSYNNNKNMNTIDAYTNNEKTRKLPLIASKARYEIIKTMKDKKENEFCQSTEKRLRDSAKIHKENYLRQLNIMK